MSAPKKYRKKPVEVEAMQMPLDQEDRSRQQSGVRDIAEWMVDHGYEEGDIDPRDVEEMYVYQGVVLPEYGSNYLEIETLEGEMTARPGDWVIRGVKGEFYPCKPEIFDATYEEVA